MVRHNVRSRTLLLATLAVVLFSSVTGSDSSARKLQDRTGTFAKVQRARTATETTTTDRSGKCSDNSLIYDVHIDIQVDFDNGSTSNCNGKWGKIRNKITEMLNKNFDTRVPEWVGEVRFGKAAYDSSQTIEKRRRLSSSSSSSLRGQLHQEEEEVLTLEEQTHRRLAQCPNTRNIACEKDICYWFCLIAPTSSCGINSLTNFVQLEQDIQSGLNALNLNCMGDSNGLLVNLIVDDPNSSTRSGGGVGGGGMTATDNEFATIQVGGGAVTTPSLDSTTETAAAGAAKALKVKSKFAITFFGGKGDLPSTVDIEVAKAAILQFFNDQFLADPNFGSVFQHWSMDSVVPEYDFEIPDEFIFEFVATILVNENSTMNSAEASDVMAGSPFKEFIRDYVRSYGGEFQNTFRVHFRGVTPVH